MALHRDIYWVGRQWAVTGYGIQACDQKQKSKFDIEAARLWEDGALESVRAEKWFNSEDFDKAIEVARKYYPEPPEKSPPPKAQVPEGSSLKEIPTKKNPVEPPKPAAQTFDMRIEGWPAKFVRPWRVRIRL
jgi:hypothetical protein